MVFAYNGSGEDRHQQLVAKYNRSLPRENQMLPLMLEQLLEFSYFMNERLYLDNEDEEEEVEFWYFSFSDFSGVVHEDGSYKSGTDVAIDYMLELWKQGLE